MRHANACWQVQVQRAANVFIILKLCHICCVPCRQGRLAATVAGGASEDLADQLRLHPPAAADRRGQLRKVWRSGCSRFCLCNSWGAFSTHANAGACPSLDLVVCTVSYLQAYSTSFHVSVPRTLSPTWPIPAGCMSGRGRARKWLSRYCLALHWTSITKRQ